MNLPSSRTCWTGGGDVVGTSLAVLGDRGRQDYGTLLLVGDGGAVAEADGVGGSMSVGPPTMSSAYHRGSGWLGDIAIPHHGQLHLADLRVLPRSGLTTEEIGDALVTQASEVTAGSQVLAITSTDLADHASPSATMADTGSPAAKVALSHFSLSPLEREPLGK
jgi:hypothetical protein